MKGKEIRKIFKKAGAKIPSSVNVDAFDETESWCCGYWAEQVGEDIVLQQYCIKGRGSSKEVIFVAPTGDIKLTRYIDRDSFPGEWNCEPGDDREEHY